jgi:aromatic ring-opening dioxygenase LigB subunit
VAITTAALVPHPPLLVPELGRGESPELSELRSACLRAVAATLAQADALLLVGAGPTWAQAAPGAVASFAPYGAAVEVSLAPPAAAARNGHCWLDLDRLAESLPPSLSAPGPLEELPLSLAVAAWLLAATGQAVPRLAALTVPAWLDGTEAVALGRALALAGHPGDRVSLLAMGDLSARRAPAAPGTFHPCADDFDQQVGRAIRDGAPGRLLDLDQALAATLMVAGLVSLQVLAGALEEAGTVRGQVLYEDAPYGVGYLVGVLRSS